MCVSDRDRRRRSTSREREARREERKKKALMEKFKGTLSEGLELAVSSDDE